MRGARADERGVCLCVVTRVCTSACSARSAGAPRPAAALSDFMCDCVCYSVRLREFRSQLVILFTPIRSQRLFTPIR